LLGNTEPISTIGVKSLDDIVVLSFPRNSNGSNVGIAELLIATVPITYEITESIELWSRLTQQVH